MLGEAAAVGAAEDEQFGAARGDELRAELRDRRSRLARLKRCQEELEAERAREVTAYEANLQWRAEWEVEHGRKLGGRKLFVSDPDGLTKAVINTTDPDSRSVRRVGRPLVQGYNAQAVATVGQIIVAADVTQQGVDASQLGPMTRQAAETLIEAGVEDEIQTVLAGGGYWNGPHMTALGDEPRDVPNAMS